MDNPLKNLNLKWWHTMLLTTSFFTFILSLVVPFVSFDNTIVSFFSLGVFFVALGKIANQSFQQGIASDRSFTTKKDVRIPTKAGMIFWIIGLALIGFAFFKMFNA